eukprot:g13516.t1
MRVVQLLWLVVVDILGVIVNVRAGGRLKNSDDRTLDPSRNAGSRGRQASTGSRDPVQNLRNLQAANGAGVQNTGLELNEVRYRSSVVEHGNPGCPYIISTEGEVDARRRDTFSAGNVLIIEDLRGGRLGNRFLIVSYGLSLGFCCKSRLVSLPPKDGVLAPGVFNEGTPGPLNFDFSGAPDVGGFNSTTCPSTIRWNGANAFYQKGLDDETHSYYTPGLSKCVRSLPPVIGCEAAYLFPTDIDLCRSDRTIEGEDHSSEGRESSDGPPAERVGRRDDEKGGVDEPDSKDGDESADESAARLLGTGTDDAAALGVDHGKEDGREGGSAMGSEKHEERAMKEEEMAGNLVMHIRSGDIFIDPVHPGYGQPPLQYYLRAIEHQNWARVDIVTYGHMDAHHPLNPVVPALEAKVADGELSGNIHFYENRSIAEDLSSMICGDGFVAANSTLRHLVLHHSSATMIYFPHECTDALSRENARPGVKVFGMSWAEEKYTAYEKWSNTPDQRQEMLSFNVTGFQECISGSRHVALAEWGT